MKQKCKFIFTCLFMILFCPFVFAQEQLASDNNAAQIETFNLEVPLVSTSVYTDKTEESKIKNTDIRMTFGGQISYNDITGPGKASSSLSQGVRHSENLGINIRGDKNDFKYNFNIAGRGTNDERVDPIFVSLTSLQARLEYKNNYLNAGDIFESFSQYS
ncbi:MAG: hypothetical protein WCS83_04750, partial [Endomicrobiia bacterium]